MFKARIKSFGFALKGIAILVQTQVNAQIHLFIGTCVILAGFYFSITPTEWILLILTMSAVLAAEAFNTAIEFLTDLVSPDHHPLAGKTKDVAAAAVLITAIAAVLIGLIIFLPHLLALFL